jgi:DNA (cytosine-5)-methyltransferase 1
MNSSQTIQSTNLNIADLFCGCGGLTLGIIQYMSKYNVTVNPVFSADIMEDTINLYMKNFGVDNSVARCCDLNVLIDGQLGENPTRSETELLSSIAGVQIVVAGPPCQGHSDLNNSTRRNDERNNLYSRVVRFCELLRPEAVIIENVPNIIHDKNRNLQKSIIHLKSIGYSVSSNIVNSLNFDIPQDRKRHILIGSRLASVEIDQVFSMRPEIPRTLRDSIFDIQNEWTHKEGIFFTPSRMSDTNKKRCNYLYSNDTYDLPDFLRPFCHREKSHTYRSVYGRLNWDRPAQTITSGFGSMGQGRYLHPSEPRVITPHEAARIQGFPDTYDFSSVKHRTRLHEIIGNAVPPQLASYMVQLLVEANAVTLPPHD